MEDDRNFTLSHNDKKRVWELTQYGKSRALRVFQTKSDAINASGMRDALGKRGGVVTIKTIDGRVQGKRIYPGVGERQISKARKGEVAAEMRIRRWKETYERIGPSSTVDSRFGIRTEILDLSGLTLDRVPESLRKLRQIENIDLGNNRLREIPDWIGELTQLKGINLLRNRIDHLPPAIGNLHSLTVLWLGFNPMKTLPVELASLGLSELNLDGLRLGLPTSIQRRSLKDAQGVLRYYFASLDEGQPLRELKLLLVGRGKAGKTSLVKRLAGEEPSAEEAETHSISIREFELNCKTGSVRTRAWDFGGQEILHSTHQFFLTERSLYLLILEPRTGLAQRDAEYWLKLIETQGGGSPAIVVMNWSGAREWHVDEVKLRRKFPFIVDFISTDALSGLGVTKLSALMSKTVEKRMKDVWLPFPQRWREIKDKVAGMSANFLTFKRYKQLCAKFGETNPDAQADLAGILHALGLALYFGKDPRLHDTRVLNPGWVTGGVYAVIRSQHVLDNDGQLGTSDMPAVLKEAEEKGVVSAADYPPNTHPFILELMRAFQLCYASEEERGKPMRYLVPELLPEFEPKMSEPWEQEASVRLRYRYEVLPPGLLPRFIVRTHALSEDSPHWRHGVVLRHANSRALIRAESDKPELHCFVLSGNKDTRQVLVTMVRRELEALHLEMKTQPIEELELTGDSDRWIGVRALQEVEQPETPRQKLPVQPDGTAEVDVSLELDKLSPASVRAIVRDPKSAPAPVRLFVSYAHDDERQLKRLDAMLDVLEQYHGLEPWRDKRLIAGMEWDREIRDRLEAMDIFLFIASQSSLVRPYIRDPELRRAKERQKKGEIEVVSVKLEPCASDEDPFLGKLQRLATKYKSIAETKLKSAVWEEVRLGLLPVIQKVREKRQDRYVQTLPGF
jgi:internalin A